MRSKLHRVAKVRKFLCSCGLLSGLLLPISSEGSPPSVGSANGCGEASPSVKIRAEEFFPVNDDDDNDNQIHDFDPTETPYLDSDGNLMSDDDLNPADLYLINPSGNTLAGYQIRLSAETGTRIWNSPCKEYELTHKTFTIDEAGVPRWQADDGIELLFPSRVFVEGVDPGSGTVSIILFDNDEAGKY